jgi:surface antigen
LLLTVALLVSVGVCAGAAACTGSRVESSRAPVVHGYLYASRCPKAGRNHVVDRWGMYACNCTSYVAWALQANEQRTDWFIRGSMDAWNWPNVARRKGLRVVARPSVRAVAVWPKLGPPFGHVAYVTRVRDDGTFDVAEYNLPGRPAHRFRFDVRTHVGRAGATFLYVPERD